MKTNKTRNFAALLLSAMMLSACAGVEAPKSADTLSKISQSKTIKLGYREDSAPFSFKAPNGQPSGYSVELCKRVAASIQAQLNIPNMDIQWIPVTATSRIDKVLDGSVDMECGSSTRTLGREQQVDFSLPTFVEGGSFISMASNPLRRLSDLNGRKLGVIPGTTTEASLKTLATRGINPQIVPITTHSQGIVALREQKIDAYATDRLILMGEAVMGQSGSFVLADDYFSMETYGLMMRRDADFRLAVNRSLARLYRTGDVKMVFQQAFGSRFSPSPLLEAMYLLSALPE